MYDMDLSKQVGKAAKIDCLKNNISFLDIIWVISYNML